MAAFIQLMDEKLNPAIKYLYWIDTKNHVEMTRPWFGKHLPFPLGIVSFGGIVPRDVRDVFKCAQGCTTPTSSRRTP